MLQLASNRPLVTLRSATAAFLIFLCMFMIRRSDFFWKLLSWFQISLFLNLNFMSFSGVRRFWDFSLSFSDLNCVGHFPSSLCAKGYEIFCPYSSSLLSSSSKDFRMSPVLLAVEFSIEGPSLKLVSAIFYQIFIF